MLQAQSDINPKDRPVKVSSKGGAAVLESTEILHEHILATHGGTALRGRCAGRVRGDGHRHRQRTWQRRGQRDPLHWKSTDDRTGTLTATLSNGDTFSGPFYQVTHDTRIETIEPLWYGWRSTWHGWPYWGPYPDTAFVTHYSGRVVANLRDPDGEHMRCHFDLMHPRHGMAGGGEGECQLPSGQTIDATLANS